VTTRKVSRADVLGASRWPPSVAIASLLAFMALLPERYRFAPDWARAILWVLVVALMLVSAAAHASRRMRRVESIATVSLTTLVTVFLVWSLAHIIVAIYVEGVKVRGSLLLSTMAGIWACNIVVFALWYWLMDRGGPYRREGGDPGPLDLLFPQHSSREAFPPGWTPRFIDYLFVAFVTSMAFSPADTLPVSRRAKLLMMMQALVSVTTVVLVLGRAVNIVE
jgi:uncharacterized membrane protein